jgi:Protein of unknown function DUF2834
VLIVFFVWVVRDSQLHGMRHSWVHILLACLFGLSGPFPLFLYVRERTLEDRPCCMGTRSRHEAHHRDVHHTALRHLLERPRAYLAFAEGSVVDATPVPFRFQAERYYVGVAAELVRRGGVAGRE